MDKKVTGIVAYIGFIGWLIAFLAGDKEGAKFHLNQGLVLVFGALLNTLIGFIPVVNILTCPIGIAIFVFSILGIISAAKDEEKPLPLIGQIQILK